MFTAVFFSLLYFFVIALIMAESCYVPGCDSDENSLREWENKSCLQHNVMRNSCTCNPPFRQVSYTNLHIRVDQSENVIFNRLANHNTLNITRVKDTCKCVVNKPKLT